MGATHVQSSILQDFTIDFTKPQYMDKFQMNRLFVAHVRAVQEWITLCKFTLSYID